MTMTDKNPQIEIVEPEENKLVLDVSVWNYKDFMQFSQLTQKSAVAAYRKGQEIIISWGYEQDLADENALSKLPIKEGVKVIRTIMRTIETALEGLSIADVRVDFTRAGWNTLDIQAFLEALQKFDYSTVAAKVHEVAAIDGVKKGDTLPLAEGTMMVKAIRKRYEDLLQGKF